MNDAPARRQIAVEAATAGLAYGSGLCWLSVSMVASFRPEGLSAPYWSAIRAVRTDTCGIAAFALVAASFCVSEYLRLRRRQAAPASDGQYSPLEPVALFAVAAARTLAILATTMVIYISVNSVTHPMSLTLPATHLARWPSEGTLRVVALTLCVFSVAVLRYFRARSPLIVNTFTSRSDRRLVG